MNVVVTYNGQTFNRRVLEEVPASTNGDKYYKPLKILVLDENIPEKKSGRGYNRVVMYKSKFDNSQCYMFNGDICGVTILN